MIQKLIDKLERFAALTEADCDALTKLGDDHRTWRAGSDLVLQGDRPEHVHLMLEGWGCQYKLMPSGQRQIVALLLPGDMGDGRLFLLPHMDYSVGVLGPAIVAQISPEQLADAMQDHPRVARALDWATQIDTATLREWVANIGQRDPYERVAHLICEMWVRLGYVGLVAGGSFRLPLTQIEIADTVSVTPVTVNRVLQRLRNANLITLREGRLDILDVEQLMGLSGFDQTYLCRNDEPAPLRA